MGNICSRKDKYQRFQLVELLNADQFRVLLTLSRPFAVAVLPDNDDEKVGQILLKYKQVAAITPSVQFYTMRLSEFRVPDLVAGDEKQLFRVTEKHLKHPGSIFVFTVMGHGMSCIREAWDSDAKVLAKEIYHLARSGSFPEANSSN